MIEPSALRWDQQCGSPVRGARVIRSMIHSFVSVSIISSPKPCGGWPTQHHEAVSCLVPSAQGCISCSPETTSRAEYSPRALISDNRVFAASTLHHCRDMLKLLAAIQSCTLAHSVTLVLRCFGNCHGAAAGPVELAWMAFASPHRKPADSESPSDGSDQMRTRIR